MAVGPHDDPRRLGFSTRSASLGRWLGVVGDAQVPALTREYQAALLQLVRSSEQEIAQRKASAERLWHCRQRGGFLSQLRSVEPSNAETLAAALDRHRGLRASYDRIEHSPDLRQGSREARVLDAEAGLGGNPAGIWNWWTMKRYPPAGKGWTVGMVGAASV